MRKNLIRLAVCLVGLLALANAQAAPISGEIEISAGGTFQVCTSTSSCTAATTSTDPSTVNGFNFASSTGVTGQTAYGEPTPTGDIYNMLLAANGGSWPTLGVPVSLNDINLYGIPPSSVTEWTVSPVKLASGATGDLSFVITGGHAVDLGTNSGGFFDLAGTGYFQVTNCSACIASDAIDQTTGSWSISNTGGSTSVVLQNVPAPATIGILGLALLGLGLYRRRSLAV